MWLSVVCSRIQLTTMRIITVVKVLWTHNPVSPQQILTTVMKSIISNKSTDHAKPHSIC